MLFFPSDALQSNQGEDGITAIALYDYQAGKAAAQPRPSTGDQGCVNQVYTIFFSFFFLKRRRKNLRDALRTPDHLVGVEHIVN